MHASLRQFGRSVIVPCAVGLVATAAMMGLRLGPGWALLACNGAVAGAVCVALHRAQRSGGTGRERERKPDSWGHVWTSLIEASEDAILAKDLNGIITHWNAGAELMFGYRSDEIVGRPITVLFPEDRLSEENAILTRIQRGERIDHYETVRRAKDGRLIDVSIGIAPVCDEKGNIIGAAKILRDITERIRTAKQWQRAEEARARNARLLEIAREAIFTWELDGAISFWNAGAENLYGYSREEAVGRVSHELLRTVHPIPLAELKETLRRDGVWDGELRHRTKDGHEVVVESSQVLVTEADGTQLVLETNRDVTVRHTMEDALRDSERRLAGVINSAMDAIITVNRAQEIVLFNPAAEKVFRCPAAEAIGRSVDRFIPERFRQSHHEHVRRFGETGVTSRQMGALGEIAGVRADGEEFPIEASISHVEVGGEQLFTVILRDVTEKKRAEEHWREAEESVRRSEEHLRLVLDTLATFVGVLTPDGTLHRINRASVAVAGLTQEDVLGKKAWDCFWWNYEPKTQALIRDACERAAAGESLRFDAVAQVAAGKMDIDFQIVPMFGPDGSVQYLIPSGVDISERKQQERAVLLLNAELEQRVRERTAALEESNRELEGFTYSVSHDLRAPLRHMAGFAQLLEKSAAGKLDEVGLRHLGIVIDSANHMGKLMDQLLAFSRMGRAALRPQSLDLGQLVSEVIQTAVPEMNGRTIEWKIAPLPEVTADPDLLRLVLGNLISNAVKFTRNNPNACIEIGSERRDGETVIWVRDNGAGFDPRFYEKLFGVFQRLHHADQFEGTGIGLANVRRIVSRHGGRTWAEGAINQGATFYFSLPNE